MCLRNSVTYNYQDYILDLIKIFRYLKLSQESQMYINGLQVEFILAYAKCTIMYFKKLFFLLPTSIFIKRKY